MMRIGAAIFMLAVITSRCALATHDQHYPDAYNQVSCCILEERDDGPLTLACRRSDLIGVSGRWTIEECSRLSTWNSPDDQRYPYFCPSGIDVNSLQWCSKPPSCCIADNHTPWDGPVVVHCAGESEPIACYPLDIHEGRCPIDLTRIQEC